MQRTSELAGVHVHIMSRPSGFTGVGRGDGDAKTIISHIFYYKNLFGNITVMIM